MTFTESKIELNTGKFAQEPFIIICNKINYILRKYLKQTKYFSYDLTLKKIRIFVVKLKRTLRVKSFVTLLLFVDRLIIKMLPV